MIQNFQNSDSTGKLSIAKISTFTAWTVFYVQVRGPQTLYLATDSQTIQAGGGIAVTSQDGVQKLSWIGDLYAIGSGPNTVADFEFPGNAQ